MLLAAQSSGLGGIFEALGVNWQSLFLNTAAFLVVVWVMAKFVYPVLVKALDAKRDELEEAARSQQVAAQALAKAEQSAAEIIQEARSSAGELITAAKREAAEMVKQAEARAAAQSERIAREAQSQLAREVVSARRDLKAETAKLVAAATERIIDQKLDRDKDAALITRSLGEKH